MAHLPYYNAEEEAKNEAVKNTAKPQPQPKKVATES